LSAIRFNHGHSGFPDVTGQRQGPVEHQLHAVLVPMACSVAWSVNAFGMRCRLHRIPKALTDQATEQAMGTRTADSTQVYIGI